MIGSGPLVKT